MEMLNMGKVHDPKTETCSKRFGRVFPLTALFLSWSPEKLGDRK